MTDVLSISDFAAAWQRHFDAPIHPFAARLLAPAQQVWLKSYDDEDTLWCVGDDSLSFVVGFVAERDADGILTWSVHLPSNVFTRTQTPRTHFWFHREASTGSGRTSTYAKWDADPAPQPFCALEITLWGQEGRVTASAFFGGKVRECE